MARSKDLVSLGVRISTEEKLMLRGLAKAERTTPSALARQLLADAVRERLESPAEDELTPRPAA